MTASTTVGHEAPARDASVDQISAYCASLAWSDLTPQAVHAVKRALVDSIGCALGAHAAQPVEIARRLAARTHSDTPATLLGTSIKTSPEMATFVNGTMVRYLDYSDDYLNNDGPHPSDNIASIIATCESVGASGKDLVRGIALAYEMVGQLVDNATFKYKGFDYVTETSIGSAMGCANVLGLSREQMAQCLALAIAPNIALFQTRVGELSMWKGCAGPNASRNGLFAALLAQEGITGPDLAIEGYRGLWNQVTGPFTLGPFGGQGVPFKVERTFFKPNPMMYTGMLPVEIALAMRDRVDVEAIESIRIYLDRFCVMSSSGAAKFDPQTRETADHSIPYLVVAALLDGEITDDSFTPQRFRHPRALALLKRSSMEIDEAYTKNWPDPMCCRIEITLKNGETLSHAAENPKGHPSRPMSDAEINAKFMTLACRVLDRPQAMALLDLLWKVEDLDEIGPLLEATRPRAAG